MFYLLDQRALHCVAGVIVLNLETAVYSNETKPSHVAQCCVDALVQRCNAAVIYGRSVRSLRKAFQDKLADASRAAEESVGNIRTVRCVDAGKFTGHAANFIDIRLRS